jgi:hypothetical protein
MRRPGTTPGDPHTEAFLRSKMPPVRTGHWLMRRNQVAGTWTDPGEAVRWMEKQYAANPPMEGEDGKQAYVDLEAKAAYAVEALGHGVDVSWGYWTQSRALASFSVVACVNRHLPELACPRP